MDKYGVSGIFLWYIGIFLWYLHQIWYIYGISLAARRCTSRSAKNGLAALCLRFMGDEISRIIQAPPLAEDRPSIYAMDPIVVNFNMIWINGHIAMVIIIGKYPVVNL